MKKSGLQGAIMPFYENCVSNPFQLFLNMMICAEFSQNVKDSCIHISKYFHNEIKRTFMSSCHT